MEIKIKNIKNYEQYQKDLDAHYDDPTFKPKPILESFASVVGIPNYTVTMYHVLSEGIVNPDKAEIKITTEFGEFLTDYSESLLNDLRAIIRMHEDNEIKYQKKNLGE
jgi:hypothetical protein